MDKKEFFKQRIDKIAKESFNNEQKEIAKKIIEQTTEDDLDAVWGLISQRVKTGFVFDEAPEINHNCIAYIKENEKLGVNLENKNALEHALIIGENYDALKNLVALYTDKQGKGLIDVIYIDPPYNTDSSKKDGNDYKEEIEGKNKFIYRDKYTRDGWLNMMNERLKLAKRILADDGAIFISCDNSEQAYLKVLCDEIFGEENLVDVVVWDKKASAKGVPPRSMMVNVHEYILVYQKQAGFSFFGEKRNDSGFKNPDNDPRGPWRESNIKSTTKPIEDAFTIVNPQNGKEYTNTWAFSKESLEKMIKENRILWKASLPKQKEFMYEMTNENKAIKSNWGVFDPQSTTVYLKKLLPEVKFDNPKPISLMKYLLGVSTRENDVILDFFAGSGTTGQAVMELNEEDGGNRKFILVTNNENNIATKITRERLFRIIKGKGSKGESLKFDLKQFDNNSLRVFDIEKQQLNITETEKAEKIKEEVESNFVKLKSDYTKNDNLNIYNVLSSLTPYKNDSED